MRNYIINELGEVAFPGDTIITLVKDGVIYREMDNFIIIDVLGNEVEVRNTESGEETYIPLNSLRKFNVYSRNRSTLIGRYTVPNLPNAIFAPEEYDFSVADMNSYIYNVDRGIHIKSNDLSESFDDVYIGDKVMIMSAVATDDFRLPDYVKDDINDCEPLTLINVYYDASGTLYAEFSAERAEKLNDQNIKVRVNSINSIKVLDFSHNTEDRDLFISKCQKGVVKSNNSTFSSSNLF